MSHFQHEDVSSPAPQISAAASLARRIGGRGAMQTVTDAFGFAGKTAARGLFRISGTKPCWMRPNLDLARASGIGDVLMCTPVMREIARRNPECKIRFFTAYPELVEGLPYIWEVGRFENRPRTAFQMEYRAPLPVGLHISAALAADLGIHDLPGICPDLAPGLINTIPSRRSGRPVIVLQRVASGWTDNKVWPRLHWEALATELSKEADLVEIGVAAAAPALPNCRDARGTTSVSEMVRLVGSANLLIGPDSGPVHVAAATGTPAIVLYGGYMHGSNTAYQGHTGFFTEMACAPCWLRTPCPYGLPCMNAISPEQVAAQAIALLCQSEV